MTVVTLLLPFHIVVIKQRRSSSVLLTCILLSVQLLPGHIEQQEELRGQNNHRYDNGRDLEPGEAASTPGLRHDFTHFQLGFIFS